MNLDNNANQVNNLNEVLEDENLFDDFSDLLDVSRYKRTVNAASKKARGSMQLILINIKNYLKKFMKTSLMVKGKLYLLKNMTLKLGDFTFKMV